MNSWNRKTFIACLSILVILFTCVSCRPAKRPAPAPAPSKTVKTPVKKNQPVKQPVVKPKVPAKISQGQNKEPVLKVYDVKTQTVKQLPLEQYIEGVVAGEMKNDWPDSALQAQAIIARTFVLQFIDEKGGSKYAGADISTDIEEAQAWNAKDVNDKIKKAINKTRGMVMVYKGKYPNAWFHSNAGGMTASAKEGLNYKKAEPPYIQVKKSPDSPDAPVDERNWTASFTKDKMLKAVQQTGTAMDSINKISISSKGPSGRVTQFLINGKKVSAPELRLALGSMEMKSTLLDSVGIQGEKIVMKGRGYGHGVGMSQWGAYALAKEGKSAQNIIRYYFKDIQLAKMWK